MYDYIDFLEIYNKKSKKTENYRVCKSLGYLFCEANDYYKLYFLDDNYRKMQLASASLYSSSQRMTYTERLLIVMLCLELGLNKTLECYDWRKLKWKFKRFGVDNPNLMHALDRMDCLTKEGEGNILATEMIEKYNKKREIIEKCDQVRKSAKIYPESFSKIYTEVFRKEIFDLLSLDQEKTDIAACFYIAFACHELQYRSNRKVNRENWKKAKSKEEKLIFITSDCRSNLNDIRGKIQQEIVQLSNIDMQIENIQKEIQQKRIKDRIKIDHIEY